MNTTEKDVKRKILSSIPTEELLQEVEDRLTAMGEELILIAESIERGDKLSTIFSDAERDLVHYFKENHTQGYLTIKLMFAASVQKLVKMQLKQERKKLKKKMKRYLEQEANLKTMQEMLERMQAPLHQYYGLSREDWSNLRVALHPDKHTQCSSLDRVLKGAQTVNSVFNEIKVMEKQQAQATARQRRSFDTADKADSDSYTSPPF